MNIEDVLTTDILDTIKLNNNDLSILKYSSKFLSNHIKFTCYDCKKKFYNIYHCSICKLWYCNSCDKLNILCIDCNKIICDQCYLDNIYNTCLVCKEPLCNKDIKLTCKFCKNPVCNKHTNFIDWCKYCNNYVCYKCMDQLVKCINCNKEKITTTYILK